MSTEESEYPSGPDLSGDFPVAPQPTTPLPFDFDENCSTCGKRMERVCLTYRTRRRPFAVFACTACPHRLYLFDAPRLPFILAHEEFPRSVTGTRESRTSIESAFFSKYIDLLIEKREEKYRRNKIRAENARTAGAPQVH